MSATAEDLLPFRLPELARISWVSEAARRAWEEALRAAAAAVEGSEWALVAQGARRCALVEEHRVADGGWRGLGLVDLPLGRCPSSLRLEPLRAANRAGAGPAATSWRAIGSRAAVAEAADAWRRGDERRLGELLGVPPCCREHSARVCSETGGFDPLWEAAARSAAVRDAGAVRLVRIKSYEPSLNVLLRAIGASLLRYVPCSFACAAAAADASRHQEASGRLLDILSWPMEWSALHGIAEIRTPVFRLIGSTDATAGERRVQLYGTRWPEEAALGLRFPYRRRVPRSR